MLHEQQLNATDVAGILHVGKNKVYEMAASGELGSYRIGRKLRFTMHDVEQYLTAQHTGGATAAQTESEDDHGPAYLSAITHDNASVVLAGTDAVCDALSSSLAEAGLPAARRHINGFAALVGMYLGQVDVAVVDLYDAKTNSYNIPYAQRVAPGTPVVLISLADRQRGFIVAEGNPKRLTTWGGLLKDGVRLAQRELGTGGRVLLDEKLMAIEARPSNIAGYNGPATNGLEAAKRVASGESDVTIGTAREAAMVEGLQFVPMQTEHLDIVVRKSPENRGLLRQVKRTAASESFRHVLESMPELSCGRLGAVRYES